MRPFVFERAETVAQATRMGRETAQGQADAPVQFLAGGTTLIDLMKLDVLTPQRVVDIGALRGSLDNIVTDTDGLHLGAMVKMSAAARAPAIVSGYPVIADSLKLAASAQLRNMATLGGNVLQKTRCPYYRDPSWSACNKRRPGSGCAAIGGFNRNHAVLGIDETCIAQYPGDFAVALVALDAQLEVSGTRGSRTLPMESLHTAVQRRPHVETILAAGEVITAFHVPGGPWNRRSVYLKIRDRASYEFAIASAAVALDMDGDTVRHARIALGGMAYRPWRSPDAEYFLTGKPLTEANARSAALAALEGAVVHRHNGYKPELGRRTLVRALMQAKTMSLQSAEA